MSQIIEFRVNGLYGKSNVRVPLKDGAAILVGPNGIGKSTILNIVYYYVSRQWDRLIDLPFESVTVVFDDGQSTTTKSEIEGIQYVKERSSTLPPRYRSIIEKMQYQGEWEKFLRLKNPADFSAKLGIHPDELRRVRNLFVHQFGNEDLFSSDAARVLKTLKKFVDHRVLYLSTYRRIEKDIDVVFPDFEGEMRARAEKGLVGKRGEHFIELISFGMEDVKRQFRDILEKLKGESNAELNNLAGRYLRDVIRGEADKFDRELIRSLTDDEIDSILERVEEQTLSADEKMSLREAIISIKTRTMGRMVAKEKYAAYYFSKLAVVTRSLKEKGKKIREFVEVCNAYFGKDKKFDYDDVKYQLRLVRGDGSDMELSGLSSGEKQVVSILSHLYLNDDGKYLILIDEPELSLSVLWQKRFLPDIMNSGHCAGLVAVTHSPFIFQNALKPCCHDVQKLIVEGAV